MGHRGGRHTAGAPARSGPASHQALLDHGRRTFATGQLLRITLDGSRAQLVDAGRLREDATVLCLDWHGP
ncbi:hypothetical protein ACIQFU_31620 [Streptomyces sp. NPDC093065]|uniref:hypothetical protein n=1 Tax=Streptomyces sp. NPDC093065 TaxID=3366021 RepID=UPI003808BDFA